MLKIALNNIYLTKGDSAKFQITLEDIPGVTSNYTLSDADQVYFIVTHSPTIVEVEDLHRPGSCIFYKTGTVISLEPDDTRFLTGSHFYYHVRVILAGSGSLNTIIEPHDFILTPGREEW